MTDLSAIILCGGRSVRFGGGDKALALVGGRRVIDRVIDAARALTEDIVLASGAPGPDGASRYAEFGWPLAPDLLPVAPETGRLPGPLAGVAAGLEAARGEVVLLLAVDLPLVSPAALRVLLDALGPYDAVIPESGGVLHPLCAVVRRAAARSAVARLLASHNAAPRRLAEELATVRLPVGPPTAGDPLSLALFNMNNEEDQVRAGAILEMG